MSKNLDSLSLARPQPAKLDPNAEAVLAALPSGVAPSTVTTTPAAPAKRSKAATILPDDVAEEVKLERLAVDIPADLHAAIKMHAAQRKSTIRDDVAKVLGEVYAEVIKRMQR